MAPTTTETETGGDRSGDAVGGGWQLGRLLGSGGMASVYAATDPAGRQAAIKLLHPEMARRRELKERFLREAYVANRIGHPSVVKILDHADGPDVFLVVELLEGEPLSARLGRASELSVSVPWRAPGDAAGERVRFYFVVRDGRGGADWSARTLCLLP